MDHASAMDNMYRYQRHFYDFTRKYYLLGRDRLIARMDLPPNANILEMGCGTARNLIKLGQRRADVNLFGLDASQEMLDTAQIKLQQALPGRSVPLRQCLAETLDYQQTFGLQQPFDAIFFSYALSMIPPWQAALEAAMINLKPGCKLYIVDFCDQMGLPGWFRRLLTTWLSWFHVHHRPELLVYLQTMRDEGRVALDLEFIGGRYAFLAYLTKLPPQPPADHNG